MANAVVSRLGQINGQGDALALMLKVFAGEVLTTFQRKTLLKALHQTRTIANGKSAQFPVMGQTGAYYHVPGDEILGGRLNANERLINIEGQLISPLFTANIDEAMNHYDVRSTYSTEIAEALARQYDQDVSRVLANTARLTTPNVLGTTLGDTLLSTAVSASYATDGTALFNGIFDAGVVFDQRDIPDSDRHGLVRPVQYALLVKSEKPIDWRFNEGNGGRNGGYDTGRVGYINNIGIHKNNNYANADDRANTLQPASRQKDYSTSQAIIFHRSAAGTLALQDVTMESAYDIRRQGTLMVGKYICGHDTLRPEAAYELQSAAPAA